MTPFRTNLLFSILLTGFLTPALAQSYAFGLKGGPSLGFQRWQESNRNVLWVYHLAGFIESAPEGGGGSMYAQAGYHVRGSAIRFQSIQFGSGRFLGQRTDEFRYNNASLQVGFKSRIPQQASTLYYFFGLRGDYTINTNLSSYRDLILNNLYYPEDTWVRKFNYGISIGGGWEFPFGEFVSGLVEISFHPDFSRQYDQPPVQNVIDPFATPGVTRSFPDRRIVNYTAEISLGLRFLRKIIYID
jgi:hypothetical protein